MTTPYDPRLREAAAEIQTILDRYDIGAFMGLFSKSHVEFKFHIEPSWSMMKYRKNPETGEVEGFRFSYRKSRADDCESTVAMLCNMRDLSARFFQYSDESLKLMSNEMQIDHKTITCDEISTEGLMPPVAMVVSLPEVNNDVPKSP